jgi:hypothetical protein
MGGKYINILYQAAMAQGTNSPKEIDVPDSNQKITVASTEDVLQRNGRIFQAMGFQHIPGSFKTAIKQFVNLGNLNNSPPKTDRTIDLKFLVSEEEQQIHHKFYDMTYYSPNGVIPFLYRDITAEDCNDILKDIAMKALSRPSIRKSKEYMSKPAQSHSHPAIQARDAEIKDETNTLAAKIEAYRLSLAQAFKSMRAGVEVSHNLTTQHEVKLLGGLVGNQDISHNDYIETQNLLTALYSISNELITRSNSTTPLIRAQAAIALGHYLNHLKDLEQLYEAKNRASHNHHLSFCLKSIQVMANEVEHHVKLMKIYDERKALSVHIDDLVDQSLDFEGHFAHQSLKYLKANQNANQKKNQNLKREGEARQNAHFALVAENISYQEDLKREQWVRELSNSYCEAVAEDNNLHQQIDDRDNGLYNSFSLPTNDDFRAQSINVMNDLSSLPSFGANGIGRSELEDTVLPSFGANGIGRSDDEDDLEDTVLPFVSSTEQQGGWVLFKQKIIEQGQANRQEFNTKSNVNNNENLEIQRVASRDLIVLHQKLLSSDYHAESIKKINSAMKNYVCAFLDIDEGYSTDKLMQAYPFIGATLKMLAVNDFVLDIKHTMDYYGTSFWKSANEDHLHCALNKISYSLVEIKNTLQICYNSQAENIYLSEQQALMDQLDAYQQKIMTIKNTTQNRTRVDVESVSIQRRFNQTAERLDKLVKSNSRVVSVQQPCQTMKKTVVDVFKEAGVDMTANTYPHIQQIKFSGVNSEYLENLRSENEKFRILFEKINQTSQRVKQDIDSLYPHEVSEGLVVQSKLLATQESELNSMDTLMQPFHEWITSIQQHASNQHENNQQLAAITENLQSQLNNRIQEQAQLQATLSEERNANNELQTEKDRRVAKLEADIQQVKNELSNVTKEKKRTFQALERLNQNLSDQAALLRQQKEQHEREKYVWVQANQDLEDQNQYNSQLIQELRIEVGKHQKLLLTQKQSLKKSELLAQEYLRRLDQIQTVAIESRETINQEITLHIKSMQDILTDFLRLNSTLESGNTDLMSDLTPIYQKMVNVKKNMSKLSDRVDQKLGEIEKLSNHQESSDVAKLYATLKQHKEHIVTLSDQFDNNVLYLLDRLHQSVTRSTSTVNDLTLALEAAEEEKATLLKQNQDLVQSSQEEYSTLTASLQQSIKELKDKLKLFELEASNEKAESEDKIRQLKQAAEEKEVLAKQQIQHIADRLSRAQEALAQQRTLLQAKEHQFEEQSRVLARTETQVTDIQQRLNKVTVFKDQITQENIKLSATASKLEADLTTVKKQCEELTQLQNNPLERPKGENEVVSELTREKKIQKSILGMLLSRGEFKSSHKATMVNSMYDLIVVNNTRVAKDTFMCFLSKALENTGRYTGSTTAKIFASKLTSKKDGEAGKKMLEYLGFSQDEYSEDRITQAQLREKLNVNKNGQNDPSRYFQQYTFENNHQNNEYGIKMIGLL